MGEQTPMLSRVVLLFLLLVAASFAQDCQLPLCTEFGVIIRDLFLSKLLLATFLAE